ncbi:MAG TPA: hypothetical protein VN456_00820 [Desulfosporosinus sp.]|nr:hypothetical protein [Desulfosporosinus sp.]
MEKKIVMVEVCNHQELMALKGCTITDVLGVDKNEDAGGVLLECKDDNGNKVSFSILEDGSWHFYDSKMEGITAEQYGELAMLAECSDIDSVHFNGMIGSLTEIVIKVKGHNSADRVLTILRGIFKNLEIRESDWKFEGETCPMYLCSDPNCYFIITVALMLENH